MSFLTDVLAHTGFFMAFLPIFFFFYVSPVQLSSLKKDVFNIFKPDTATAAMVVNPNLGFKFPDLVSSVATSMENNQGIQTFAANTAASNKKIVTIAVSVFASVAAVLIITAFSLQFSWGESMLELLVSNLIVLAFIVVSEFAIVGVFLSNFIEIDDGFVKGAVGNAVNDGYCGNYVGQFLQSILPSFIYQIFYPSGSGDVESRR